MNPPRLRGCPRSSRAVLKPRCDIEPSAQMISKVCLSKFAFSIWQFKSLTRFRRLFRFSFLVSLASANLSGSIATIIPLQSSAKRIVGTPVPQPTSRMVGLFILGIKLNARVVYLSKLARKISGSMINRSLLN